MHGFTNFYNPAFPACLVGGRVPWKPHRFSPSERRVCFPSYRAHDRARVLIWCQMDALIDGLSAQLIVVHPLLCPVLHAIALLLSLLILNQPPPVLVPLFLVLFLLPVFTVVSLAILSGNAMISTDPAVPILHRYTYLQLLLIYCLFLTGHPFLAISPSAPGHFQSDISCNLQEKIPPATPMTNKESVPQINGPAEPVPDKGDNNDCIITDYIPPTRVHYSGNRYFKRVKSYNANIIGQETVVQGHMGYCNKKYSYQKILLLGCYCE